MFTKECEGTNKTRNKQITWIFLPLFNSTLFLEVYFALPVKTNLQKEIMLNLSVYKNYFKKKPETNKRQQTGVKFFKRNFVLGRVLELTAFIVNENKRKEG